MNKFEKLPIQNHKKSILKLDINLIGYYKRTNKYKTFI